MWQTLAGLGSAALSLLGQKKQQKAQDRANQQNADLQREFAQNSLQWRVADARKAGIHPVFAMGASPAAASPSFQVGDHSGWSKAGQDLTRAVSGMQSSGQRALGQLALERAGLENDLLKVQIRNAQTQGVSRVGEATSGDHYLIPGQPNSGATKVQGPVDETKHRHASHPGAKNVEYGAVPGTAVIRTPTGYSPVVSKHAKQGMEDMSLPQLQWQIRNNILPAFSDAYSAIKSLPKPEPGKKWKFNIFTGEYQQVKDFSKFNKRPWEYYRK